MYLLYDPLSMGLRLRLAQCTDISFQCKTVIPNNFKQPKSPSTNKMYQSHKGWLLRWINRIKFSVYQYLMKSWKQCWMIKARRRKMYTICYNFKTDTLTVQFVQLDIQRSTSWYKIPKITGENRKTFIKHDWIVHKRREITKGQKQWKSANTEG